MYFQGVKQFDINKYINNNEIIYAHVSNDDKELLKEHLDRSLKYFYKLVETKNLSHIFDNLQQIICKDFNEEEIYMFKELLLNTIYMHDLGKININFQAYKMKNKNFLNLATELPFSNSKHSMISSLIYMDYFYKKFKENNNLNDKKKLKMFLVLNAYVISKHHSKLDHIEIFKFRPEKEEDKLDKEGYKLLNEELCIFEQNYKEKLKFIEKPIILINVIEGALNNLEKWGMEDEDMYFNVFIYTRLLMSILLSCDYYATSEFDGNVDIENFGVIDDINKYYDSFNNTNIVKQTREYEKNQYKKLDDFTNVNDINVLRKELFLDAEERLLKNIDSNIFYLEAPTGSGKSNVAFNLTFKLIEKNPKLNKLFYVYPFNTLVEQNRNTIKKIFEDKKEILENVAVINSIVPIKEKKNSQNEELTTDYKTSLLDRQFLHYPIVLTTHVSLFNYLFGTSKEDIFPLAQLCNSVIVLDEIQSYKNSIWKEIIIFLKQYAKILNIKVIIMSATLPNLDELSGTDNNTTRLILHREKYFLNKNFKDRVNICCDLLKETEDVEDKVFNQVIDCAQHSTKNILIEFINKSRADEFYNRLISHQKEYGLGTDNNRIIEKITGDDNIAERNRIINKVKNNKENIILVATQVIEAGVDIDMDIGYKDISILDCDEQFLGRINRSCLKQDSKVFFFNLDNASGIYKGDYRKQKDLTLASTKYDTEKWLKNKEFHIFYSHVINMLNEKGERCDENNIRDFISGDIGGLNFINVKEKMKLIDDDQMEYTVFLNRDIELNEGERLSGEQVWNSYKALLQDNSLEYAKKKVELSKIMAKMNNFIYKVSTSDFSYEDCIGEIYYIEDSEKYFNNGKFDRKEFNDRADLIG